jgi:hypothetical protein
MISFVIVPATNRTIEHLFARTCFNEFVYFDALLAVSSYLLWQLPSFKIDII